MTTSTSSKTYLIASIICGGWFLLTGAIWVYYANLFVGYPIGLIGFLLWRRGRSSDYPKLSAFALHLLGGGLALSLITLFVLLLTN